MNVILDLQSDNTIRCYLTNIKTGAKQDTFNIHLDWLIEKSEKIREKISDINNYKSDRTYKELKNIGHELFNALFKGSLEKLLHDDDKKIHFILSKELLTVPFEALFDKTQFVANKYVISKELLNKTTANENICVDNENTEVLLLMNPTEDKLLAKTIEDERKYLKDEFQKYKFKVKTIEGLNITIEELNNSLPHYLIVYYAGHSFSEGLLLNNDKIFNTELLKSVKLYNCQLIYLNSCNSAQIQDFNQSIVQALLENPSSNFNILGNIVKIETDKSSILAKEIFKSLFQGKTIGEALLLTRKTFNKAHKDENLNVSWLALSYYGDPNWKLPFFKDKKADNHLKADELYAQKKYALAAKEYEKYNLWKNAAECCIEINDYFSAGKYYGLDEDYEKAGDCFKEAEEWDLAYRSYIKAGNPKLYDKIIEMLDLGAYSRGDAISDSYEGYEVYSHSFTSDFILYCYYKFDKLKAMKIYSYYHEERIWPQLALYWSENNKYLGNIETDTREYFDRIKPIFSAIEEDIRKNWNIDTNCGKSAFELLYRAHHYLNFSVDELKKAKIDINAKVDGQTLLMRECEYHNKWRIQSLLENGADVNLQDNDGNTALMRASKNGYLEIVKLLLSYGADVNLSDRFGNTAYSLAKKNKATKVVRYIEKIIEGHEK